ncbi:MAG: N-acetylmuramoyl-L-alanine amidase [Candidatus Binataceae bacterium]
MRTELWNAPAGAAIALGAIFLTANFAHATITLTSAKIERRGPTQELRFKFNGIAPRFRMSAHGGTLRIDLGGARIGIPPRPLFGYEAPPIQSVRAIEGDGGDSRIVVAVKGKTDYAAARVGHEIILRIAPAGTDPDIAAPILVRHFAHRRPPPIRRVVASAAIPKFRDDSAAPPATHSDSIEPRGEFPPGHPLVMIDPGHGGYDPGTHSAAGVTEKSLALQISERLKTALEARGIHAEMTRDSDEFISLPERTKLANRAGADLFISIHLNSSPNPDASGIEVYYLNNTTDRATIRLARMENGTGTAYGASANPNLHYILADLRQNYKAEVSASLAAAIDSRAANAVDTGFGLNMKADGARRGPFYVLVGARMPAVLVECGFLSNAAEAARTMEPRYQETLALAIAAAVANYFNADLAVGNL